MIHMRRTCAYFPFIHLYVRPFWHSPRVWAVCMHRKEVQVIEARDAGCMRQHAAKNSAMSLGNGIVRESMNGLSRGNVYGRRYESKGRMTRRKLNAKLNRQNTFLIRSRKTIKNFMFITCFYQMIDFLLILLL